MDNPLYKSKSSQPVILVPMTTGPSTPTLSLEGDTKVPPTKEAIEKPEGDNKTTSSTPATSGMMITIPYALLERLV